MSIYANAINEYIVHMKDVLSGLDLNEIDTVANIIKEAYEQQRTIFVMGNGGSGATASHIATDLNKGACFHADKKFKVMALTDNVSTILALGNDVGYDNIFLEQMKNFVSPDDIVIGISASGNSANVIKAIDYADSLGCKTIGFSGYDGGQLKRMVECSFHVNVNDMQIVEDVHMMVGHILMQILDVNG